MNKSVICCIALKVTEGSIECDYNFFREVGNVVRVRKDSKFFDSSPKTDGRIVGVKEGEYGWTYVTFLTADNKVFQNRFRTGENPDVDGGVCDLEPASGERVRAVLVNCSQQSLEVYTTLPVEAGDTVKLERQTFQVVGHEKSIPSGSIAFVSGLINDEFAEVDFSGSRRTVYTGKFSKKLEVNGRVVLDQSGSVIIQSFGLKDDSFLIKKATDVHWDDIKGQDKAVLDLRTAVELPIKKPKHFKFLGIKAYGGFLIFGPPGCSKTMLVQALYTAFIEMCLEKGIERPEEGFILINGPEILDKFLGVPEASLRHAFAKGRAFFERTGIKAIVAIDECEAILAKRGSGKSSDILRTIVPTVLAETQGVRGRGVIPVYLTNESEILDGAAVRDGRIDCKIEVKRPTREAAKAIFIKNMEGVPVSKTTTLEILADTMVERLFSPDLVIFEIKRISGGIEKFTLANVISGAMIPSIVLAAQKLALNRELLKEEPSEGLRLEDIIGAVQTKYEESFSSDHESALKAFGEKFKDDIADVTKLRQLQK